jgi:sigma-B regulation protein RsbU (phosphoserine phosphatase)
VGKSDFDYFTKEHAQPAFDDEQEIIKTGKPVVAKEERETFGDRDDLWVSTTKMPLQDPDGNIIGTFGLSRDITQKKTFEIKLEESEAKLREHVDRMEQDLRRAQIVQGALLPTGVPSSEHFKLAFRFKPVETIGGDYIAFFPQPTDGVGVFVGDVAGHGVSAALFVAMLKFLTDYIAEEMGDSPSAYIESLNEDIQNEFPAVSVSAVYGCFQPDNETKGASFEFAAGGHPPPIMIHASGEVSPLASPGKTALGAGSALEAEYAKVSLEKGDRVLLYSDGFSQTHSPDGAVIKPDELLELIKNCSRDDIDGTLDAIIEALNEYRGGIEPKDDIILCGVEVL